MFSCEGFRPAGFWFILGGGVGFLCIFLSFPAHRVTVQTSVFQLGLTVHCIDPEAKVHPFKYCTLVLVGQSRASEACVEFFRVFGHALQGSMGFYGTDSAELSYKTLWNSSNALTKPSTSPAKTYEQRAA